MTKKETTTKLEVGCINLRRVALRTADSLVSLIVVFFLVVAGAYSAYSLWDNQQVYAAVDNVQASLMQFKPVVSEDGDGGASFDELLAINPDVKGWLTLDGTAIDYPVLQGETNFSYINTDVYGNFALAGSIFLDSDLDGAFTGRYNLLYGHHMENSKMFGDLDLYKDESFFAQNTTGTLILPDRTYHLETIACLLVPASEDAIFHPYQWSRKLNGLIDFVQENAIWLREDILQQLDPEPGGSQILAMSTCSSEFTDARTILLAWMIPAEPES